MIKQFAILLLYVFTSIALVNGQCTGAINSFPYREGFESSNGGWNPGGIASDWAWGTPSKPLISAAAEGTKCWITGGLTSSLYASGEASFIESPCFDFSNLQFPMISFKIFWETEQQFDGASFQYSTDLGNSWQTLGSVNDPADCLTSHWYNQQPVTYLSSLSSTREGWSGNIQTGSGSCRSGNGSNGWVTATHSMQILARKPNVMFRFVFGAGTICNSYDGFAVDDIIIGEAPPNAAAFTFACTSSKQVKFTNTSSMCPTGFNWNFGDPASGLNNTDITANPVHQFSGPGKYTVSLTVSAPGNSPSTITHDIYILSAATSIISPADCQTGIGGSATVAVNGAPGPFNYSWNTTPVQTTAIATGLGANTYSVTVSATDACNEVASVTIPLDSHCSGIYFPAAFTPDNNSKNDRFGALGNLAALKSYKLSVYNRWGEVVFSTTDPYQKWDGRVKGWFTDTNIFIWMANYQLDGEAKRMDKGTVVLIR